MASSREEGPVYYREIQKNAYLKRIPNELGGSKLRPLGSKKVPLKPMWTQFCVHNGRTPYLEQYPEPDSPATMTHKPVWRACLRTARHVTASVKPHCGTQYDFLVDTDSGAVRMLAPDWDSMQDWVSTLRSTLLELNILARGENVYCAGPAPPAPPGAPRAAARDPTSPLPPTPPVPPDRVPGIELATPTPTARIEPQPEPQPQLEIEPPTQQPEDIDISNWDTPFSSLPSTSLDSRLNFEPRPNLESRSNQEPRLNTEPRTSLAKICGQNICLDDSILKRSQETEYVSDSEKNETEDYKQTVVINNQDEDAGETSSNHTRNVTVIQVSNKDPPHTAIPVIGSETDVFNFEFKQNLTITEPQNPNFINIVNTEQNTYGTAYPQNEDYGHLSLTTTVNLVGSNGEFSNISNGQHSNQVLQTQKEDLYERLCLASTSTKSPLPVKKIKNDDLIRKSSLPNLEGTSDYEYLFLSNNNTAVTVNSEINCNENRVQVSTSDPVNRLRSIERSRSQNACDSTPAPTQSDNIARSQNGGLKRDTKNETTEHTANKPIWKRGLTELSLLTKLKSITQKKETSKQEDQDKSPAVTSSVKVVRRSRPEGRVDSTRRRSSSLSNVPYIVYHEGTGVRNPGPVAALAPLRRRQAQALLSAQSRGAALAGSLSARDGPVFATHERCVWVATWGAAAARMGGRAGDRLAAVAGQAVRDATHAVRLLHSTRPVDILFHRVPLGKIYVINKRENETLGLKLDAECNIIGVEDTSICARAGLPPPGCWALTEINNRPINLLKGGEEDMLRLSRYGSEVSILIQPSALVKKLRAALKGNKALLGLR